MVEDLKDIELYEFIGVLQSATTDEIKSAYRKQALKCHPDKNPDNPEAAQLFHKLTKVLEVLIDESARGAYDKVLNGKKAAKLRNQELDSKRRKFKEDLEAREREAVELGKKVQFKSPEEILQAEIERLRKESSKQLQEEIELVRQQVLQEKQQCSTGTPQKRLKVHWASSKSDDTNGGYNSENLNKIFLKYGDIEALVISSKKRGSALVEFTSPDAANNARKYERGFPSNPLTLEWLENKLKSKAPESDRSTLPESHGTSTFPAFHSTSHIKPENVFSTANKTALNSDYETLVMRQMRQAQERKRLIEEMMKGDI